MIEVREKCIYLQGRGKSFLDENIIIFDHIIPRKASGWQNVGSRRPSEYGATGSNIISRSKTIIFYVLWSLSFFFLISKKLFYSSIFWISIRNFVREKKKEEDFRVTFSSFSFYTHNRFIIISRYLSQFRENRRENRRKGRNNRAIRGGQFRSKSRPRVKFERGRGG